MWSRLTRERFDRSTSSNFQCFKISSDVYRRWKKSERVRRCMHPITTRTWNMGCRCCRRCARSRYTGDRRRSSPSVDVLKKNSTMATSTAVDEPLTAVDANSLLVSLIWPLTIVDSSAGRTDLTERFQLLTTDEFCLLCSWTKSISSTLLLLLLVGCFSPQFVRSRRFLFFWTYVSFRVLLFRLFSHILEYPVNVQEMSRKDDSDTDEDIIIGSSRGTPRVQKTPPSRNGKQSPAFWLKELKEGGAGSEFFTHPAIYHRYLQYVFTSFTDINRHSTDICNLLL